MMPSTYISGQDASRERHFVIRTESPRFIAALVESGEADDGLILEDGEGLHINQLHGIWVRLCRLSGV